MSRRSLDVFDVLIVGTGAAGLAALGELSRAGCKVLCLEARDYIGGRIRTVHDPLSPIPIELGAEFIHGRPPEIWDLVHSAGLNRYGLTAYDCAENAVHIKDGHVKSEGDAWEMISRVMDDMQRAASRGKDRTFSNFLQHSSHPEDAKRLATSYVEGFNAARSDVIGIASLAEDAMAADKIDGDHSFRLLNGYESLALNLFRGADEPSRVSEAKTHLDGFRLNRVVQGINWRRGSVEIHARSALTGQAETFRSRRAIITVPLGVLQAEPGAEGAIAFDPQPGNVLEAARELRFGHAIRVVLRFREPFWENKPELSNAGFLLSQEEFFPTWWTALPIHAPVIVGWSAGSRVDRLLHETQAEVLSRAIADLARVTDSAAETLHRLLEAAYTHEWHTDPFARGAYSYVPAGALASRKALAKPVARTLYFAGEATELNGHSATVHGAIASGKRAAQQVLNGP